MKIKRLFNCFVFVLCVTAVVFAAGAFIKVKAIEPATAPAAAAAGQPVDLTYAAAKALPSVVYIKSTQNSKTQTVEVENPFSGFFDPFGFFGNPNGGDKQKKQVQTPKKTSAGSGVIITADGYIVTNNHVVTGADEITVTLDDNTEYSARIIGTDENTDLALIKVDGKNLPAITIADSDELKVGEWVLAVGNPYGFNNTVTAGIVSAKARMLGANPVESFIQTDAAINSGNSGGALVDVQGRLVGINAMLYSQTGSFTGYGFAIPTTIVNKVVDDLRRYGTVQRAVIGIQGQDVIRYIDAEKEKGNDVDLGTTEGVYVAEVEENGAGEEAGLLKGDVITAVDSRKVTKMSELQEYITNKRPGDKVTITYMRNKAEKKVTVTLRNVQGNTEIVKQADLDLLGANFREVTDAVKEQLGIKYGLEVVKVNNGVMKDAGISKGYIIQTANDKPVKTIDDLQEIVKEASLDKEPVLYLKGKYPTGKTRYYAVQLKED